MVAQLVSVGYQGRSVEDVVTSLVEQGVSVLVDVRLTPLSRKPGLSKRRLEQTLSEHGISYVHLPDLGNPKDNRIALRAGEPNSRRRFTEVLNSSAGALALSHVAELLDDQTVALLCFERNHDECHRKLVAERLRKTVDGLKLVTV